MVLTLAIKKLAIYGISHNMEPSYQYCTPLEPHRGALTLWNLLRRGPGLLISKTQFWPMGWGDGLDMFQQLEGGFRYMRIILPMWGLGAKNGSKTENLKESDRAKLLAPFDMSRRADNFDVVGCQNRTSNLFCPQFTLILRGKPN